MKRTDSASNAQRPTVNAQASVDLHIEELVLHGFACGDRYVIGETVEHELARLLGEQGIPNSLHFDNAIDEIRAAAFNAAPDARPVSLGQQIAHALYQGFKQ